MAGMDPPAGYNPYLRQPFAWDDSEDTQPLFDSVSSFAGGQYSYAKPRQLGPTQSALLENCEEAITGQLSTRFGTAQIGGDVGSTATAIHTVAFYNAPGFVYEVALGTGDAHLYYNNGGVWTIFGGATSWTDQVSIVQGVNNLFLAGGTDISSWNGTVVTDLSSDAATTAPRNASILVWHTNRLVAAGPLIKSISTDPVVPDAVYFSNFLDATTWGANKNATQIRVGAGDGIPITAVVSWNGINLAVFKRNSVWVIVADPSLAIANMPVQRVHPSVGCVARRTAVQVGSDVMFLSDDGVRSLQQVIGSEQQHDLSVPLSFPVQDVINRIAWSQASQACAAFWRNRYILAIPVDGSTYNNYLLVYNTQTGAWTGKWTNLPIACFSVRFISGIPRLFAGLANARKVVEYLDYIDPSLWVDSTFQDFDGSNVQPHVKTLAFILGESLSNKIGIGGEIEWNNSKGSLTVTPILDEVTGTPFTFAIPSGGFAVPFNPPFSIAGLGLDRYPFDLMQYGEFRQIQFDILGSGAGRKEIRQIAFSAIVRPSLVGSS